LRDPLHEPSPIVVVLVLVIVLDRFMSAEHLCEDQVALKEPGAAGPPAGPAGSGHDVHTGGERRTADAPFQSAAASQGCAVQAALHDAVAPADAPLRLSTSLPVASWDEVAALWQQARAAGVAGLMLKRRDSVYGTDRQRGAWWKWKVAPFTCDAVLVAAQPGHGRRATLFTDYTFAVWSGGELVPVAKANAGLTDDEIDAVDAFVRANTTGRFGPVRSVKPELVFELAFEDIARSTRHKSGLALRSPRIARWRHDQQPADADTMEILSQLAETAGAA
jgi:DNA ligase-1